MQSLAGIPLHSFLQGAPWAFRFPFADYGFPHEFCKHCSVKMSAHKSTMMWFSSTSPQASFLDEMPSNT